MGLFGRSQTWEQKVESGYTLGNSEIKKLTSELSTRLHFQLSALEALLDGQRLFSYSSTHKRVVELLYGCYFLKKWVLKGYCNSYMILGGVGMSAVSHAYVELSRACDRLQDSNDWLRVNARRPTPAMLQNAVGLERHFLKELKDVRQLVERADERLRRAMAEKPGVKPEEFEEPTGYDTVQSRAYAFSDTLTASCGVENIDKVASKDVLKALKKLDGKLSKLNAIINEPEKVYPLFKIRYGDSLSEMLEQLVEFESAGVDTDALIELTLKAIAVFDAAVDSQLQEEQDADMRVMGASLKAMQNMAEMKGDKPSKKTKGLKRMSLGD